jgi:hypothetical protein
MNQIMAFNKLLEQQYQIMTKDHPSGMPSMPPAAPNGSNSNTCKFLFFSSYTSVLTDIITIIFFCQNVTMELTSSNIVHCCLLACLSEPKRALSARHYPQYCNAR